MIEEAVSTEPRTLQEEENESKIKNFEKIEEL